MVNNRMDCARHAAVRCPHDLEAPRAAAFCRFGPLLSTLFASVLMVLGGVQPAAGFSGDASGILDTDRNGVEDILDRWLAGQVSWEDLRLGSRHPRISPETPTNKSGNDFPSQVKPASGPWENNLVRIIALGNNSRVLDQAGRAAGQIGDFKLLHNLDHFGGVQVMSFDPAALETFLAKDFDGRILLDRDGLPSLVLSRQQVGAEEVAAGHWNLGDDWSATVAILDSGCDTAHGDLGDFAQDDQDGPPPEVGDATDWYSATQGWPLFEGYKVVGWHDVTDDFPEAQGPWDYHFHGTALASVVAGNGSVDPDFRGLNPGGRLTVVKFFDFDQVWHAWAGDFLAACAWTLENRATYRIRSVLVTVNWEVDLGISLAMDSFLDVGMVPVAAMGNFGDDPAGPGFPASLGQVLTVGSTDPDGAVSSFSGRGLPGQTKPDLLAPGGGVTTADNEPNDTYSLRQGTSLAAAHVVGAANLLEEALVDNGLHLPADRTAALTRLALLRATAARVDLAASPDGSGPVTLPSHNRPDEIRGWGQVRVDAAVRAVLLPLFPGGDQEDTLSIGFERPVTARRLALSPGVRYLVEAVPQAGLDVDLAVLDPRDLDDDSFGSNLVRENSNGPGVSEFIYYHAGQESWAFLVVRQVSGSGLVTLRVNEAGDFSEPSVLVQLPGSQTGAPNVGQLAGSIGPTLVVPSRVDVDFVARSVNVFDSTGVYLTGWPVFVFPHPSAQGGLSQPVVWDLDGIPGDEIVLGSEFGSVYFFNRLGAWVREELGFNLPLTTPVGMEDPTGGRRVLVLDPTGSLHAWSWGPVLEVTRDLGHLLPLDPAVGQLVDGPAEELVVAFASGVVIVLDWDGNTLPGWPIDLGVDLTTPPVLCDLDEDGLHDIILPNLDESSGQLRFQVLAGDGTPGPGHGSAIAAPAGGQWLMISDPVVAGRYGTGDLRISVTGLMDSGLSGTEAAWSLGQAELWADGSVQTGILPGLDVVGTTSQGVLTLQKAVLPNPLAWDFMAGTGTEVATLFGLEWTELLYGLTTIDGSGCGWYRPTFPGRPLEGRTPLRPGGSRGIDLAASGALLVPLESEVFLLVQALDNIVNLIPALDGHALAPLWGSARGDQRNTGAYPLRADLTPTPQERPVLKQLSVYPNPGSGQFQFRLETGETGLPIQIQIYDLRGRHIKSFTVASGDSPPTWDGLDSRGRQVAAGSYLAIARQGTRRTTSRFVVTR